MHTELVLFD